MSVTDKSLTAEEIRARYFERDIPIDRHGNYMPRPGAEDQGRAGFCALLHYHLIEGLSDKDALARMKLYEMSDIEAAFTLKRAKAFITDVLQIDLDGIRKGLRSTDRYIYDDVQRLLLLLDAQYEDQRHGYIDHDGHHFQADEKSRGILGQYIQAGHQPDYWLDTLNNKITPFAVEDCQRLLATIVQRDQSLHAAQSEIKTKIRQLAEARDYTGLKALAIELGFDK